MIIMYETRSFSESRTMKSFIHLVYAATALFVVLYSGLNTGSYIVLFFAFIFLIYLLLLLKNLIIQVYRMKLKPTTWKIDLDNKDIKYSNIPWKYSFNSIKAFYISETGNYVEFIMNRKYYRIWRSQIDQNKELFESFTGLLDDSSSLSQVPLEVPTFSETRKKTILYTFLPYIIIYVGVLLLNPSLYDFLQQDKHLVSSFIILYMFVVIITTRVKFFINVRRTVRKEK